MYVGGGMWMPPKPRLDGFRAAVRDDPDRVRDALEDPGFVAWFDGARSHDSLKRVPPGYPADHPLADLFRWKDVVFGRRLTDAEVCSADLPDRLAEGCAAAMPVFRFLPRFRSGPGARAALGPVAPAGSASVASSRTGRRHRARHPAPGHCLRPAPGHGADSTTSTHGLASTAASAVAPTAAARRSGDAPSAPGRDRQPPPAEPPSRARPSRRRAPAQRRRRTA
jgi:hypothetical protein